LILSGNTLYGTTIGGGTNAAGTVFAVNTDGSGFTTLYDFTGGNDGAYPFGGLILTNNTLYGTTSGEGPNSAGNGTVFKVNIDGTGFTTLHGFSALDTATSRTNSDGANPVAGLILSGNTLYGAAQGGGTNGSGTVFAINTDGSGFTTLYTFGSVGFNWANGAGTNSDGGAPYAGLTLSGNTLYGTAQGGGTNGAGTVFALNTAGTGFTVLHSFTAGDFVTNTDGFSPSRLILSGNTLYGTANIGGTNANGTVFAINTDGSGFTTLYTFGEMFGVWPGSNSDGARPDGPLVLSGNTLYGTAYLGGIWANGTVFSLSSRAIGIGPPSLTLVKAVKPSFSNLTLGTNYQLQVSTDLNSWTNQGAAFTATNSSMVYPQYFDVDNWNQLFFRLQ